VARPKLYDDDLRGRLIAGAAQVLSRSGPDALSLRPLAAAEATSTSAVYAMFGGKSGLVAAVVAAAQASFLAAQRSVAVTDDPRADLRALGQAYRDWALTNPTLYAVMFGGQAVPDCEAPPQADDEGIAALRAVVERLVAAGLYRDDGVDVITLSIWAGVHGLVSLEIAGALGAAREQSEAVYGAHLAAIDRGWLR
jgi:AcrR family transcriptional regulator